MDIVKQVWVESWDGFSRIDKKTGLRIETDFPNIRTKESNDYVLTCTNTEVRRHIIKLHNEKVGV